MTATFTMTRTRAKKAVIVVGLGYGDEAKGATVDWLARQKPNPLVVRFNGGPQAAHNVVLPDGRHHTFASFGSGTFAGARTHISRFALVNPLHVYAEAEHLCQLGIEDPMKWITFDPLCKVITPWHKALNRIRERARGEARHGSCGHGVGEVMAQDEENPAFTVQMGFRCSARLFELIDYLQDQAKEIVASCEVSLDDEMAIFSDSRIREDFLLALQDCSNGRLLEDADALVAAPSLIFEGAQGVLLDENYGWNPWTTWSTTTPANAMKLLTEIDRFGPFETEVLGLIRTYMTRHGPGPFPTEAVLFPTPIEKHNGFNEWQRSWRVGHLDLVALRYALECCRMTVGETPVTLGVSCLDQFLPKRLCVAYDGGSLPAPRPAPFPWRSDLIASSLLDDVHPIYETVEPRTSSLLVTLAEALRTPISLRSVGPTHVSRMLL